MMQSSQHTPKYNPPYHPYLQKAALLQKSCPTLSIQMPSQLCHIAFRAKSWSYKYWWDRPIKDVLDCAKHGELCQPGRLNRVASSWREFTYVNQMPNSAIFTLWNFLENSGKLDSSTIKRVNSLWGLKLNTYQIMMYCPFGRVYLPSSSFQKWLKYK
jgi:hypothetical protein